MTTYQIISSAGVDMGTYTAETIEEALDAMAQDAGYASQADAAAQGMAFTGTVEEAEMTSWSALRMFAAYDSDLRPTDAEFIAALREWRSKGCIRDWCFERVGGEHERDDDQGTWGPASVDAVGWTGFPTE